MDYIGRSKEEGISYEAEWDMSKHRQCEDRRMWCDQDIINSKFWPVKQLKETRN